MDTPQSCGFALRETKLLPPSMSSEGEGGSSWSDKVHSAWLSRASPPISHPTTPRQSVYSFQPPTPIMLTKYLTAVHATFSPFNARAGKTARNFLALLPPNARSTMAIDIKMMGKEGARSPARLGLKFSEFYLARRRCDRRSRLTRIV